MKRGGGEGSVGGPRDEGGRSTRLLGAVLAGGGSGRFGSPKPLARLHGTPLWRRAVAALEGACARVVVVANDGVVQREVGRAVPVLADRRVGLGPLGGLDAALARARADGFEGALILAADMPWTPSAALRKLVAAWERRGGVCLAASASPWGFEPLCGVYPATVLDELAGALAEGARAAGSFAGSLGPLEVDAGVAADRFRSVNVPADLPPPAFAVVGNKNSGKTTLAVALLDELARRGRRAMSVKHGHGFRLDRPGTDSWRHREEGRAGRVVLAGPADFAVLGQWPGGEPPGLDALLRRYLFDAEVVVVEGFRGEAVPKVEIFRSSAQPDPAVGPQPGGAADVLAVATDRPDLPWTAPVFDPDDPDAPARIVDLVEARLL